MSETDPAQPVRGNIDRIVKKFAENRGLDLGHYRRPYLERRVAARMRLLGLTTYRQYAERLDAHPEEYAAFVQTLTINVTDFFRDGGMWDALREEVIPAILSEKQRHRGRTIRVWSAGCATGEEPYSVAMLLLDLLGDQAREYIIAINGTDIDPEALAFAERGYYQPGRLQRVPEGYRDRFFVEDAAGGPGMLVRPEVRRLVRFSPYSLFDDSPMKLVDLVLCRNVFIYLGRDEQAKALDKFWAAMSKGGFLVLGRSEKLSAGAAVQFEQFDTKERIYRKPRLDSWEAADGRTGLSGAKGNA